MKNSKFIKLIAMILILLVAFPQFIFAADNIGKLGNTIVLYIGSSKAMVNNVEKVIDVSNSAIVPVIEGGRTLVPIRFVSENMGMKVDWDNATKIITITSGSDVIKMRIDSKSMYKNGVAFNSDVSPNIKNGKTFVPLRVISENFGKNVFFDRNLIIISEKQNTFDKTSDKEIIDILIQKLQAAIQPITDKVSQKDKSVVAVYSLNSEGEVLSQGSAFSVAPGVFVTNYHIVANAAKLKVKTTDNKEYEVEGIVSADALSDLALFKLRTNPNIPILKLAFDKQNAKGQKISVIGSKTNSSSNISSGTISGLIVDSGVKLINVTAPITDNNSGGPMLDVNGDVIGVNSSVVGNDNENIAVSIDQIYDWYKRLSGVTLTNIPTMGRENYTKDLKISDTELINTLNSIVKAYNSENLEAYQSLFNYVNDTYKKSDAMAIGNLFKQYDIKMSISNPKIVKKTIGESLVRATISYTDEKPGSLYPDNKVQFLFYITKVGTKWKVYKIDAESVIITSGAATNDTGTSTTSETSSSTPVVTTPGTTPATAPTVDLKAINVNMAVNNFKYNEGNNKIYALNEANKKLIVIDAGSKSVEKVVNLKYKPSDLTLSSDNNSIYIVNEDSSMITELSLNDFTLKRELSWDAPSYNDNNVHFHIEYYNNKLYLIDGKWAPSLWILDLDTEEAVDFGQNNNYYIMAEDKIDNVGDLVINQETGDMYFWLQYGWSSGYDGSNVYRYALGDTGVSKMDDAGLGYPNYKRDPLDTPILMVKQKNWIISKNVVLNMNNLKQVYKKFDEALYAIDFNGKYAVSKKNIYDMDSFNKISAVPLQDADFFFFDKAGTLYMVDNKSSSIKYYAIK